MIKRRQILIAGMGTSPAVLSNAVWALGDQEMVVELEGIVPITEDDRR
jgi:hypothetical protein